MYAVYNYQAGSTAANVIADLIKLLTGETNKANLSANCVQANTSITSSVAAGWSVHDASAGTNQQVIKSLNQDGVSYKYYLLGASSGSVIGGQIQEYWDANTHTAAFASSLITSTWDSSGGGYFYIYATSKNIVIQPWTAGGYQILDGLTVAEVSRDGIPTGSFIADGQSITARSMSVSSSWSSMCYGNSKFVAVAGGVSGLSTTVAGTSSDGVTWTTRTLPTNAPWISVAYGNVGGTTPTYVAIAGGGATSNAAATSSDGITWTARTLPATTNWSCVIYAGGQFVAVAGSPEGSTKTTIAATSPDGITWTQRTLPVSNYWASIAHDGTNYVTIGGDSTNSYAATSPDGITWTQRTFISISAARWASVTYGNGKFLAVCGWNANSTVAATSPDGITWTAQTMPASSGWRVVLCTSNGMFIATCSTSTLGTSPDGITWTQRSLTSSVAWAAAACSSTLFVAANYTNITSNTIPLYVGYYACAGLLSSVSSLGSSGATISIPRIKNATTTGDSTTTSFFFGQISSYSGASFLSGSTTIRDASENVKLCVYRWGGAYAAGKHFGTGYDIYLAGASTGSTLDEVTYSGTTYVLLNKGNCCILLPKA